MAKMMNPRRAFLKAAAVIGMGSLTAAHAERTFSAQTGHQRFVFGVDVRKCVGCDACVAACKAERNTPLGVFNTWVEKVEVGNTNPSTEHTHVKVLNIPKLCNHCENPACVKVCPVHATYKDESNGLVLQRDDRCIGCRLCEQSCPYGVRYIDPMSMVMNKCTWCDHRTTNGLKPACVDVCPTDARVFGDSADENDPIHKFLNQNGLSVLKAGEGTKPRVLYVGLEESNVDYVGEGSAVHHEVNTVKIDAVTKNHHTYGVKMQHNKFRENL